MDKATRADKQAVRGLMAELPNPYEDANCDRALAHHLRGERYPFSGICQYCHDLSWRRAAPRCPGCGGEFSPEEIEHELPSASSSIALCEIEAME